MPHKVDEKLTYDLQHADARATKSLLFSRRKHLTAYHLYAALEQANAEKTTVILEHDGAHDRLFDADQLGRWLSSEYANSGMKQLLAHPNSTDISGEHLGEALVGADLEKMTLILAHATATNTPLAADQLGAALLGVDIKKTELILAHAAATHTPLPAEALGKAITDNHKVHFTDARKAINCCLLEYANAHGIVIDANVRGEELFLNEYTPKLILTPPKISESWGAAALSYVKKQIGYGTISAEHLGSGLTYANEENTKLILGYAEAHNKRISAKNLGYLTWSDAASTTLRFEYALRHGIVITAEQRGSVLRYADAAKTKLLLDPPTDNGWKAAALRVVKTWRGIPYDTLISAQHLGWALDVASATAPLLLDYAVTHNIVLDKDTLGGKLAGADAQITEKLLTAPGSMDITAKALGAALKDANAEKTKHLLAHKNAQHITAIDLGKALDDADDEKIALLLAHPQAKDIAALYLGGGLEKANAETKKLLSHTHSKYILAFDLGKALCDAVKTKNSDKEALIDAHIDAHHPQFSLRDHVTILANPRLAATFLDKAEGLTTEQKIEGIALQNKYNHGFRPHTALFIAASLPEDSRRQAITKVASLYNRYNFYKEGGYTSSDELLKRAEKVSQLIAGGQSYQELDERVALNPLIRTAKVFTPRLAETNAPLPFANDIRGIIGHIASGHPEKMVRRLWVDNVSAPAQASSVAAAQR